VEAAFQRLVEKPEICPYNFQSPEYRRSLANDNIPLKTRSAMLGWFRRNMQAYCQSLKEPMSKNYSETGGARDSYIIIDRKNDKKLGVY
jgi:hypothetical protein